MNSARRVPAALALLAGIAFGGCSRLVTEYGHSDGYTGETSLNGFAALRSAFRRSGFSDRKITRLSDRVRRADAIVWTPQLWGPIDARAIDWIEAWLAGGDKTLLYIIPDSGSEVDYWRVAQNFAPLSQRLEYRKHEASAINERIAARLTRSEIPNCGWFNVVPLTERAVPDPFQGDWKSVLRDGGEVVTDAIEIELFVEPLAPLDDSVDQSGASAPAATTTTPRTVAGSWMPTESHRSELDLQWRSRLESGDGKTVVAEITSPSWKQSRIIVVAGGSWLTNFALTRAPNRQLAERIVRATVPAESAQRKAVFLSTTWSTVPVSDPQDGIPKATGMEILTVWPISWVTMHGVLIGLVVCLVLFPVFGRPRRVRYTRQGDFGDHLDAVAALMNNTAGTDYAHSRIGEYRQRIHGESHGSPTAGLSHPQEVSH